MSLKPVVVDYIKKYQKFSTRALAKALLKDHPAEFKDYTSARNAVRYARGEIYKRKVMDENADLMSKKAKSWRKNPNFTLPESDAEEWLPIEVGQGVGKMGFMMDVHIPYHDRQATQTALEYFYKEGVDGIFLNGDIIDCYKVSRWIKDPRKRNFSEELDMTRDFLGMLRENFDGPIYYNFGNHEERYETFLKAKAPELLGVPEFELANLLRFGEFRINEIGSRQIAQYGKLFIVHGHELGRSIWSPVNAARGLYLRGKTTALAGHWHQTSEHNEKSMNMEIDVCWSVGCLCDLHPEYAPINKWNHGCAVAERVDNDGHFVLQNKKIYGTKIY